MAIESKRLTLEIVLGIFGLIGMLLAAGAVGGSFDTRLISVEEAHKKLASIPEAIAGLQAEVKAMHADIERVDKRQEAMISVVSSMEHRAARLEKK